MQTRRRAYRPQRIVRHNAHVARLSQRRYLLGMRYPARQAHIRPNILHRAALQQHVEFVDGMQPLPRRYRHRYVIGYQPHSVEVLRQYRILIEHRMKLRDALRQHDRLRRRQPPVYLYAQIHLAARRLAVHPHGVYGVRHLVRVRLVVWHGAVFVKKRRQMPNRREPVRLSRLHPRHQLLPRFPEHMVIHPRPVPNLAAQQLIHRRPEMLARDVPQRNVYRAYPRHYRRAPKMPRAIHRLPVMLYQQRIFPHQIRRELQPQRRLRRLHMPPSARLAVARYPRVRMNLHEQIPVHRISLNRRYLHWIASRYFVALISSPASPLSPRKPTITKPRRLCQIIPPSHPGRIPPSHPHDFPPYHRHA